MGIIKDTLLRVFRLSPNYFAFLSGVFISASINLYTSIVLMERASSRFQAILVGSVLLFVSGVFCSIIAWNLESINRLAIYESPKFIDEQKVWEKLVQRQLGRLFFYLISAILLAVLGFFIIPFG